MTETPERIWAEPGMPGYTDEPNEVYTVEYVHGSLLDEAVKALEGLAECTSIDFSEAECHLLDARATLAKLRSKP